MVLMLPAALSSNDPANDPDPTEGILAHRGGPPPDPPQAVLRRRRILLAAATLAAFLVLLLLAAALFARHWLRAAVESSLPQTTGSLRVTGLAVPVPGLAVPVPGFAAPVFVHRDPRGTPSIQARSLDDLLFAQGFVTAQDRLFQMDTLRRHAAGELAEVLGKRLLEHDRSQRVLSLGSTADRILEVLPPDQLHTFDRYAAGVNASIALQAAHLPVEFRVLAYQPRPWSARDCVLVSLVLFEELTNTFPEKLEREMITASLAPGASPELRAQLLADLYPVGSWRDHPPSQPPADVTAPLDAVPEIPLDESQTRLRSPVNSPASLASLAALRQSLPPLPPLLTYAESCMDCRAGSNNWAVSGEHTASGKPLLSNDMHLSLTAPGIWYAVDLQTTEPPSVSAARSENAAPRPFHVAGVSLPGVPFVVSGHNDHVAWGFTNLGADVQDLFLEHLRGAGPTAEFRSTDGQWHPIIHRTEQIRVRGSATVTLDVASTVHGDIATPILTPLLPTEQRPVALLWSLYDTAGFSLPFAAADAAPTGAALAAAFAGYTGPTQNLVYADISGHIGYHAIGRIPVRGSLAAPTPLAPLPIETAAPDAATHEWAGFIPFEQLPATTDPTGGILATANSRITPDNYPFPVTLNWAAPYRTERIWHQLTGARGLTPTDMLRLQTDVYSDSDKLIAHRFAYAIDHTPNASKPLRRAADLLRSWNGEVLADTPAPAIVSAARTALWTLLLAPKLATMTTPNPADTAKAHSSPLTLYTWGERDIAQEQIITHQPARWLPSTYGSWDELFSATVARGLDDLHAPSDPGKLRYGRNEPTQIELPLFAQSILLRRLIGMPTGTPELSLPGNGRTVRQTHRNFGASERLTVSLTDPVAATLVFPLGESANPASAAFLDQISAWLDGSSFPLPFGSADTENALTLEPR